MTRHTHIPPPQAGASCVPGRPAELVRSAETSAALIELAISESRRPVETLAEALRRISAASAAGERPIAADVAACVESLQFHDRMIQQLTHVRDLLAGVAAAAPARPDLPGWPALREALRSRFTSESHRLLFNLLMPQEAGHAHIQLRADEGSVELF